MPSFCPLLSACPRDCLLYTSKKILDEVKTVTYRDLNSILKEMDRELTKGALSTEGFGKYFWDNCRDEALAETVREILK